MTQILRNTIDDIRQRRGQDRTVNLYRSTWFPVVDEATEIDITYRFLDSEMAELFVVEALAILKEMLLPKYHYNEALYDLNLRVTAASPILSGSRSIPRIAPDPGQPTDINRFRMVFAMRSHPYHETSSSGTSVAPEFNPETMRTDTYESDITGSWGTRRRFEVHKPEKLQCKFFQLWNPSEVRDSRGFRRLLKAIQNGTGLYYPPFGFSDIKNQIQYQYDVEWLETPQYYASLMFDFLNGFGFDIDEVPFLPPINVQAFVQEQVSSLLLTWEASSVVHGYNVYVNGVKHNNELIPGIEFNQLIQDFSYSINDIENGEYEIWITSVNGDWESDPSEVHQITFSGGVEAPQNFSVDLLDQLTNPPENFSVELVDEVIKEPENFNVQLIDNASLIPENFNVDQIDMEALIPKNFSAAAIEISELSPDNFEAAQFDSDQLIPENFHVEQE